MTIISGGQFFDDQWRRVGETSRGDFGDWMIVDWDWLDAALCANPAIDLPAILGAAVPGEYAADLIDAALLARLSLVEIVFAGMSDGRGFSLAQQLRKVGYHGHLRASGPLIPDQYPLLEECGFGSVALADVDLKRHGEAAWKAACGLRPTRDPRGMFAPAENLIAESALGSGGSVLAGLGATKIRR